MELLSLLAMVVLVFISLLDCCFNKRIPSNCINNKDLYRKDILNGVELEERLERARRGYYR